MQNSLLMNICGKYQHHIDILHLTFKKTQNKSPGQRTKKNKPKKDNKTFAKQELVKFREDLGRLRLPDKSGIDESTSVLDWETWLRGTRASVAPTQKGWPCQAAWQCRKVRNKKCQNMSSNH